MTLFHPRNYVKVRLLGSYIIKLHFQEILWAKTTFLH